MASPPRSQATHRRPWEDAAPEELARRYYDATTWIYRLAWGPSFHFSPLRRSESRRSAIRRYEEQVATALAIRPGWLCLDLGCGIGGPASTIASLTAARIVGVNSNLGQLRALSRTRPRGEQSGIRGVSADFAHLPFAAGLFDCAYAFEALCHAVDLEAACREVHRVLRPGGVLGFSEWCLTEIFDPGNTLHGALRRTIEASYGVVRLRSRLEWRQALLQAGFRITTMLDQAERDDGNGDRDPWYRALLPRDRTLDSLGRRSSLRALQGAALSVAERCRLAPRGTAAIVRQLREGTAALVEAGRLGIFTPMLFVLATRRDAASM